MERLTNSQKSIWVTEQYYKGSSINNIFGTAIVKEKIDFEKLKKAVNFVCEKHSIFKMQFKIIDGEIMQEITSNSNCKIELISMKNADELKANREKFSREKFDIENNYLSEIKIIKFLNGQGAFAVKMHHLISDGWTMALICNDIIKTYSFLKNNQKIEEQNQYSYIDYINSEKEYQKSEKFKKDKAYWEEQLKILPEIATIPGSKATNNKEINSEGNRLIFKLDKEFVLRVKEYCKKNNITLYNFFMAIYGIYISEITNLDEFIIGTPILNRTNYKEKNTAGMFINMIPFKINLKGVNDFKEFIKNVSTNSFNMLKHQKYSYQQILEQLREKNNKIPNLYNILLSYQITNAQNTEGDIDYNAEWIFNGCCAEDMDIQIYDLNDTGNLNISYDYKISLYNESDIENTHKRIINIIEQVIKEENIKIKDIEIITTEEKEILLNEFNKTNLNYDKNIPIIKYFEEQAKNNPDNIAIVFENKTMTYKELNEKANSLAFELRKNGVTNNTIVGIMKERSFEMMIAILAVLKSGGCYIPIATDYPDDRIEYMLKDSNAKILLVGTKEANRIKENQKIINIDLDNVEIYNFNKENIENISNPEDLSYMIYTSGSTGIPKGVMLKQQNLTNFYNSMKNDIKYLNDGQTHKIISITTVSFDIFIFESLISLTRGLCLYMTNENEQKSTVDLERIVKDNSIEILQTTPSVIKNHLSNLIDQSSFRSLKYIMLAGEPLSKELVDEIKEKIPKITIYNGYGPSETTIFSTTKDVTNLDKISIGKPIANTQIYILNKNKKLVPKGIIGEMYISGDGVGKGYMNKKEQTESNFIKNIFENNKIMYKSGDLGTFDENGDIFCYGRVDNQVKIRGLRIELSEIEKQIMSFENILNCVVVKKQVNGRDVLCAYYIGENEIDEQEIKKLLNSKLPQYMVPNYFTRLEKMPYTPNGKIDKKTLIAFKDNVKNEKKHTNRSNPRNEKEEIILNVIRKKINQENYDIDSNIFDYGADSLTIINIITELFKYNLDIKVFDMYKYPTIRELSDNILKENKEKSYNNNNIEFSKINNIAEKFNNDINCKEINSCYNVLLTGATGFFGCHLLIELLKDCEKINKVYCIVRSKNKVSAQERLVRKIKFYFGNSYIKLVEKYVEVIEGEISDNKFFLDTKIYNELGEKIDIVIHSAANVNHYGNYNEFEKANIIGTKNIIDFCRTFNKQLHYISTMTVSGNYLLKQEKNIIEFSEKNFYIGQNFDKNVYSKSKLIAEAKIIEGIEDGLTATIYRLGDLTGRFEDGVFQENIDKNAIYLRLKTILQIGCIPNTIAKNELEFSPVDNVATAVKKIIWSDKCKNRIFNVYNPNMIVTETLLEILKKYHYNIDIVTKERFLNIIDNLASQIDQQEKISGIINDFTEDKDLVYNYVIKQKNNITCQYLKNLNFMWNNIDEKYIHIILQYMKKVKFID